MGLLADDYGLMAAPLEGKLYLSGGVPFEGDFYLSIVATVKSVMPAKPLAIEIGSGVGLKLRERIKLSGAIDVGASPAALRANVKYGLRGAVTVGVQSEFSERKRMRPEAAVVSVGASEAYFLFRKILRGVAEAVAVGSAARMHTRQRSSGSGAVSAGVAEGMAHERIRTGGQRFSAEVGTSVNIGERKKFAAAPSGIAVGSANVGLKGRKKRRISEADTFTVADERGLQELFYVILE